MSLFKRIGNKDNAPAAEPAAVNGGNAQAPKAVPAAAATSAAPATAGAAPPPVAETDAAILPETVGIPENRTDPPIGTEKVKKLVEMSLWIVDRIQSTLGTQSELKRTPETEQMLQERFAQYYRQVGGNLSDEEVKFLFRLVYDEILGFGPLQQLIDSDGISEIMVNCPNRIYIEQKGKLKVAPVVFANNDHVLKVIDRIIRPLGRRIDRKWPLVDARLPDGSRVNAVIPPCAIDGPNITIRKFSKNKLKVDDLIRYGSMTPPMAMFLEACVVSRRNIIISGGTGSGKTTLINVLSNFIPAKERVVTIEDSAELQLIQDHVIRLEAKPADVDGTGKVAIRDLVINALRMRPERIIIGECRGGETLDLLQAMNTGHDGSMSTLHSNSPREAVGRIETMCMMAGMDLPLIVIRKQIASSIHMIVQQSRLDDGQRKVTYITEIQGMEGDVVVQQDIFKLEIIGKNPEGKILCEHRPTGVRPKFTPKLEAAGYKLPPEVFGAAIPGKR
ncbi:MAG: CpaF family protein [Chloroflexaceae bacterium]|nr:CpaF family protein [Chloroflexaceae bacterium]